MAVFRNHRQTIVKSERERNIKKDKILIEVAKDEEIGEYVKGFKVIKPVKRFGKYYVLVENK